jgi:hypothetical protein
MKLLACFIGLSLTAATSSYATVLFSENFDSYTSGVTPTAANSAKWLTSYNQTSVAADIVQTDINNYLGSGTTNKVVQISQLSANASNAQLASTTTTSFGTTGQLSFDFTIPLSTEISPASNAYNSTNGLDGIILRMGTAAGNGTSAFGLLIRSNGLVALSDGTFNTPTTLTNASLSLTTKYNLTIVYNNSSSLLTYTGGSVAATSMDVYLNGVLVGDDLTHGGSVAADTALSSFSFTNKSTSNVLSLYVDNILVTDTITAGAIPEPSTVAVLAGLGSLTVALVVRRNRR